MPRILPQQPTAQARPVATHGTSDPVMTTAVDRSAGATRRHSRRAADIIDVARRPASGRAERSIVRAPCAAPTHTALRAERRAPLWRQVVPERGPAAERGELRGRSEASSAPMRPLPRVLSTHTHRVSMFTLASIHMRSRPTSSTAIPEQACPSPRLRLTAVADRSVGPHVRRRAAHGGRSHSWLERRTRRPWVLAGLTVLAATACAEPTAPIPALEGTWTSRGSGQPMAIVVRAAAPQAGQTLAGDAYLRRRDGSVITSAVSGTTALPRVVLALLVDGQRLQLDGRLSGDTLTAAWVGGTLDGRRAILVRASTRTGAGIPTPPEWSDSAEGVGQARVRTVMAGGGSRRG